MKMISIDIETTGLDLETCSVLSIGAVIFDPQPDLVKDGRVNESGRRPQTFHRIIKHSKIVGEPVALQMNASILAQLAGTERPTAPIVSGCQAVSDFVEFILGNTNRSEKLTVVGKNFDAFDRPFLRKCFHGWQTRVEPLLERRVLDVGSLVFHPTDGKVLNLKDALAKVGIRKDIAHNALDDALDVMSVVRRVFEG